MSFTLIGFGKTTRDDLGATGKEQPCVWCSVRVYYHLILVRTWFTYFFIPVFAYRSAYYLECPACTRSVMLSRDEVKAAKRGELTLGRG
jgi:hypothetical protein